MNIIQNICAHFTSLAKTEPLTNEMKKEIKVNLLVKELLKLNPMPREMTPLYLGSFFEKKDKIILNLKKIKQIDDNFVGDFAFRVIFEKNNQASGYDLLTILCYECEISQNMNDDLKEILNETQKRVESFSKKN